MWGEKASGEGAPWGGWLPASLTSTCMLCPLLPALALSISTMISSVQAAGGFTLVADMPTKTLAFLNTDVFEFFPDACAEQYL